MRVIELLSVFAIVYFVNSSPKRKSNLLGSSGNRCISDCIKNDDTHRFQCNVGTNKSDTCSPRPGISSLGHRCLSPCALYSENHYTCHVNIAKIGRKIKEISCSITVKHKRMEIENKKRYAERMAILMKDNANKHKKYSVLRDIVFKFYL